MRRSLGKFANPSIVDATRNTLITSSSAFSTSAGGGGRGRGRGSSFSAGDSNIASPGKTEPPVEDDGDDDDSPSPFPTGLGHGRGKPLPSSPTLPSFSSFMSAVRSSSGGGGGGGTGRGSGRAPAPAPTPPPRQSDLGPKRPIFFTKEDDGSDSTTTTPKIPQLQDDGNLPASILSVLSGAGRGKPAKQSVVPDEKPKVENRHFRSPPKTSRGVGESSSITPKLSTEEAVKKAVGILSAGGLREEEVVVEGGRGSGGGYRGRGHRGGRGRGVQSWRGRGGRGRGRGRDGRFQDGDDDYGAGLFLGDNADGENLAKKIGPEKKNQLVEAFEEMGSRVLPSPMEDAYVDAFDTNMRIECEPEYLMEEFGKNPDIDEKPPISLRDAFEKMKPFLMAYEGIQSQEEWEKVMEETMKTVPLIKEIVDYYSGPDRVTAKQQQEELERVAKTLPERAPASVKRFTGRAVLSLQSNPGWGFDKKCQFMDKLVREVSQHYK